MWPFNRNSRKQQTEECDHEWREYEDVLTYPQNIYHEEGQSVIYKTMTRVRECEHCPASEHIETTEKKVYLEVARVEEIEDAAE